MSKQHCRHWLSCRMFLLHLRQNPHDFSLQPFPTMIRQQLPSSVYRYGSGGAMMTDITVSDSRPPFTVHSYFLETAFELRFQSILRLAWLNQSWHVIAAVPGSGKSLG